jgi:hypothetical protein
MKTTHLGQSISLVLLMAFACFSFVSYMAMQSGAF